MSKKWTKCLNASGVWYTQNFAQFIRDNELDPSTCYSVRKGSDKKSIHGWSFDYVDELPDNAKIWGKGGEVESQTAVDKLIEEAASVDSKSVADMSPVEKYRLLSELIINMSIDTISGKSEYPTGWRPKDLTSVLESYGKTWNIDPKRAMDTRTDADKVVESAEELMRDGARIFEQFDPVLNGLRVGFQQIKDNAEAYYEKMMHTSTRADDLMSRSDLLLIEGAPEPEEPPNPKVIRRACQKWIDALREVNHMAELARRESTEGMTRKDRVISQSTHTLRYQLYVGRPDITEEKVGVSTYKFGQIHVRMSMRLWLMRQGAMLHPKGGIVLVGEQHPSYGYDHPFTNPIKYDSFLGMLPPRHGKTDWVIHDAGLNINKNTRIQMAVLHDKEGEASKVLRATQNLFDIDTAQGRRNAKLFTGMRLADYDNNKTTLRVHCEDPPRNANFMAAGVWGSGQGNNLDIIYGDDLVPQSDKTEHNKRTQRKVRFAGTWLTRLQGPRAHVVLTGYPRHHEDLMWGYYLAAETYRKTKGADGANIMTVRIPVGGPNTDPPFKEIWPEMYPASELKRRYTRQNDAPLWAANYMLRPITDDQKIVRKTRYFDIDSAETERFLKNATYHLSVDPAAKGDGSGDNAGLIVAAVGDVLRIEETEMGQLIHEEKMMYVVHEDEFPATQTELTEHMVAISSRYPIETAHVEVVTGLGRAITEALETYYNIDRVVEHPVRNKGKASRLRAVAPTLEHSDPLIPAKVAFAGKKPVDDDGRVILGAPLVPIHEMSRLISYVENFAVESGFHSLDALTQLCKWCIDQGDLAVHQGEFSRQASTSTRRYQVNSRRLKKYEQAALAARGQSEEYSYFGDSNNMI